MRDLSDEHVGEHLEGLAGTSLEKLRFEGCVIEGALLAEAMLRRCIFEDCTFVRCDLSLAKVHESAFRDVRFEHCKVVGVDFTTAYPLGFSVRFESCAASYASFAGLSMRGLQMLRSKVHEASFDGADLRESCFAHTDLLGARFVDADLRGADLADALHVVVDPRHAKLKATKMSIHGAVASARLLGIEVPELE